MLSEISENQEVFKLGGLMVTADALDEAMMIDAYDLLRKGACVDFYRFQNIENMKYGQPL